MKVTLDMTIEEIVQADPRAGEILMQSGMDCVACSAAAGETLAEAAEAHGVDAILLMRKLNLHLNM